MNLQCNKSHNEIPKKKNKTSQFQFTLYKVVSKRATRNVIFWDYKKYYMNSRYGVFSSSQALI